MWGAGSPVTLFLPTGSGESLGEAWAWLASQVIPVKSPTRKDILANVKRTLSYFYVVATGSGCALVQLQPLTGGLKPQPVVRTDLGLG